MDKRYLGVDLGGKRIGLASSEPGGIVSPLAVLPARATAEDNARAILGIAAEYGVSGIVIGLPLNMDGSKGPQTRGPEALARAIEALLVDAAAAELAGWPVSQPRPTIYLHDERLSTFAADERLAGRELTRKRKKARQDALAAQVILQSFLECSEN